MEAGGEVGPRACLARHGDEQKNLCSCWKSELASPVLNLLAIINEDKLHTKNKKFWNEVITYIPLIKREPHRKRRL
jgi:hypothetical protein